MYRFLNILIGILGINLEACYEVLGFWPLNISMTNYFFSEEGIPGQERVAYPPHPAATPKNCRIKMQ